MQEWNSDYFVIVLGEEWFWSLSLVKLLITVTQLLRLETLLDLDLALAQFT